MLLCVLQGVVVRQENDGRCHARGDGDIDADGANGQSRSVRTDQPLFAYAPKNAGLDLLKNAGYPRGAYQEILVCDRNTGEPIVFEGNGFYSRTAYRWKDRPLPDRYLDSVAIPFIVVEDLIRRRAHGIVLGCKARATNTRNGQFVDAVVGDIGPLYKFGELSIAAAEALGIDSNPRTGGESEAVIEYEFWPGTPAVLNGETYDLIPRIS